MTMPRVETELSAPKLRLRGVSKTFFSNTGFETTAVSNVDLDVASGEFVCVVGPSGCGKSTVMNLIAGLDLPSTGTIELDGKKVTEPGSDRGVMFQDYALFPWLTVIQNVAFGLEHGTPGEALDEKTKAERVRHYIDLVRLTGSEGKYPHQLSGGMRQRVALARLLANDPQVLLMDEPLGALDAQTRLVLQSELLRIWGETAPRQARRTAIFITHDIEEAVFLADRVVVMGTQPGHVRRVLDIDLPRPRDESVRGDKRFGAYADEIWRSIRDEAYRATV